MQCILIKSQNRIELIGLGLILGNVSQACRLMGVSRQHYYDIKKIYERHGAEALKESATESHFRGRAGSNERGTLPGGQRNLSRINTAKGGKSTLASFAHEPGELLIARILPAGFFREIGLVYLHCAVDAHNLLAFAELTHSPGEGRMLSFLAGRVLPFYAASGLRPRRLLIGNAPQAAKGGITPGMEHFCASVGIEPEFPLQDDQRIAIICKHFDWICQSHLLRWRCSRSRALSLESMRGSLCNLLRWYNESAVQKRGPCRGRTPSQAFQDGLKPDLRHAAAG